MDPLLVVVIGLLGMFVLIGLHIPIGVAMAVTGIGCFWVLTGDAGQAMAILKAESASAFFNLELSVIPLFLLMGGFATAAGMSGDLYRLAQAYLGHYRGGLALATIGACAGFGTVCGSSIATAATMTRIALPEMRMRGYGAPLAAGAIAAGGGLGMLIPPSILMVLYCVLTEQSVLALFAAAVVPAVITVLLYMIAITASVRLNPGAAPPPAQRAAWPARFAATRQSWRVVVLAFLVSGGIYGGVFTVSEAAAVGGAFAFLFYLLGRRGGRQHLVEVLGDTAGTTCMFYVIIIGAATMSYFVTLSGAPALAVEWINAQGLPPIAVIGALCVMYIVIGSIFDTIAGMVITLPFVYPLVVGLGYDPIWWGLMMIVLIEVGMITPPIGLNVFVLHGMAPELPLRTIFRGVVPFLVADAARIALFVLVPEVVTWLPAKLGFATHI